MRICQVSKADAFGGGASRVAEELNNLLNARGCESQHLASWAGKGYNPHRIALYGRYEEKIRKLHAWGKKIGLPEVIPFELPIFFRRARIFDYDLFHFHDLSSAISPLTLAVLAQFKPVVWTIHDCSPFTGGCLYPMECTRYMSGCGSCPQVGEWPIDMKRDTTSMLRKIKWLVHRSGVVSITPSNWMADRAQESGALTRRPLVINNGIDVDLYQPHDKKKVREEFGLPVDRPYFLISAGNLADERKGSSYALAALEEIKDLKPYLILLGGITDEFRQRVSGFDYYAPGYVGCQHALSKLYSMADVFMFCSLADNQPLAIIESLSSGTPIIGFHTGGVPELISQDETGFLVKQRDVKALVQAIRAAITEKKTQQWGKQARERAVRCFSHRKFASTHLELYDTLIQKGAKGLYRAFEFEELAGQAV